jgi:hypothetical protein
MTEPKSTEPHGLKKVVGDIHKDVTAPSYPAQWFADDNKDGKKPKPPPGPSGDDTELTQEQIMELAKTA